MRPFRGTASEVRAWVDAISAPSHQRRVRVRVMNLQHRVLGELTQRMVSGEVTIDVARDTSRVLTLTLADPTSSIGFEPDTVGDIPTYQSRMLRVDVLVKVPGDDWKQTPVFTGPIADFDRDGALVHIVGESKERLALGNFYNVRTYRRKWNTVNVIREIMEDAGETRFDFPRLKDTLPENVTVNRGDTHWEVAARLARSIGRRLEYDARGTLRLIKLSDRPTFTIAPRQLAAPVKVDRQAEQPNNRWIVQGPKPKGGKKRVWAEVALPGKHPLSAHSLARNGKPHWRTQVETRDGLKSNKRARSIGRRLRDEQLRNLVTTSVDCLCFPHVDGWDLWRIHDPYVGAVMLRIKEATIPLDGSPMTLGQLKRGKTTGKAWRRRHRSKYTGGR